MQFVRTSSVLSLVLASCASVPTFVSSVQAPSAIEQGELRLLLGAGQLDEDTWEPTDQPIVLGVEYARQAPESWLGYEFGFRLGVDTATVDDVDLSIVTGDLYGGYHHTFFPQSPLQPYFGLGVALVTASAEASQGFTSISDEDVSFGFYAHAGVAYDAESFILGLDGRYIGGTDVDMFGGSFDVDMSQVCLFVGFGV